MSLTSSLHGGGRSYSRSAARRQLTQEQMREAMAGIEFRDTDAFIDEIPAGLQPNDQVMADAGSLVSARHTLQQIMNVKGPDGLLATSGVLRWLPWAGERRWSRQPLASFRERTARGS